MATVPPKKDLGRAPAGCRTPYDDCHSQCDKGLTLRVQEHLRTCAIKLLTEKVDSLSRELEAEKKRCSFFSKLLWELRLKAQPAKQVFLKTLTGATKTLDYIPEMTVDELKDMIEEKEGIPWNQQRLIYQGKQWEDLTQLSRYNFKEEHTVHLCVRLRGGKPVILLYPERLTDVSLAVQLSDHWVFSALYPVPTAGDGSKGGAIGAVRSCEWRVLAQPDGILTDQATQRQYPSLFWEAETVRPGIDTLLRFGLAKSFCVAAANCGTFLDEALAALGLNVRERCEMVTYWLPQMLQNPFNVVCFAEPEHYGRASRLTVVPQPDVTIRVFTGFRGVAAYDGSLDTASLAELKAPERRGFVCVEWGGMNLDGV